MAEKAKKASKKIGTDAYKGVRDFYPEEMFIQEYIFSTMSEVAERFGYDEYGASILEPTELYASKTSDEIVNDQTYTFIDRGERSVTLRPEMTPTVARMVAARKRELAFPLRWYSIPNMFRYERPQRGRLREFWQLNCDLFGIAGIEADVEIISLAYHIMRAFGALNEDFEIRVNDRRSILSLLEDDLELSGDQIKPFLSLLDRREKLPEAEFEIAAIDLIGADMFEKFVEASAHPEPSPALAELIASLTSLGVSNVIYDPELIRGFDYYTGIIFEVFDTAPENNRSLFGGGRYDNLLDVFGAEKVPAVGFGMGDVPIHNFLETRKLLPTYTSVVDLALLVLDADSMRYAQELAQSLREQGLHVSIDFTLRKAGDQIKAASKSAVPYIALIGATERGTRTLRIKELENGTETEVPEGAIADFILAVD